MIERYDLQSRIIRALESNSVTALLGPRQCGKTTIALHMASHMESEIFDLENPVDSQSLLQSPLLMLESRTGLVVLDEIQLHPELFPILRVLADRSDEQRKFLILGSASPNLIKGVSESLAGRVTFIDMGGLTLRDVGIGSWRKLWLRGSFPRSYTAEDEAESFSWRDHFIRAFLERDLPQMGITVPAASIRRFWTMLAHFHGQVWNGSEFARAIGATEPTARKYLDLLSDAYVVRQLQPWHENLKKRQVKSPKVYVRDSGLMHVLLSLQGETVLAHPKLGASWEGFVIEQILEMTSCRDYYFWATHAGAELDLLLFLDGKRIGVEIKFTDAPRRTKSMLHALNDLKLDMLYVVYPGARSYPIDPMIKAIGVNDLFSVF